MGSEIKYEKVTHLLDHLFRYETGKLTSVLTRIFGAYNLELAEDVVQDTLLEAINVWNYKGVPENPVAWLYKVAKNKALNIVNREKYKREYATEVVHFLKSEWTANAALENLFSESEIRDDHHLIRFIKYYALLCILKNYPVYQTQNSNRYNSPFSPDTYKYFPLDEQRYR